MSGNLAGHTTNLRAATMSHHFAGPKDHGFGVSTFLNRGQGEGQGLVRTAWGTGQDQHGNQSRLTRCNTPSGGRCGSAAFGRNVGLMRSNMRRVSALCLLHALQAGTTWSRGGREGDLSEC